MSKYLAHPYYFSVQKRIFDLLLSFIGLVILIPIFFISYPLFAISVGRPIIFKQKRMGKNKKPFTIYKIRTMKPGAHLQRNKLKKLSIAPYPMFKIQNDPRFHSIGKILSKFGVDELPQLINILQGEMSFVGPRPLPVNEAKLLDSSWNFRYEVKPGILSKWALSPNRYKSLASWKKLEKKTLRSGSLVEEIELVFMSFYRVIVKQLFR